jgi:hypothetical protein
LRPQKETLKNLCSLSKLVYILLFPVILHNLQGQDINTNIRSLDNNHALATDSSSWSVYRKIKEIPLTPNRQSVTLSLGGDIREQIRYYDHINFGDTYPDKDFYLLQRYMLHADLHLGKTLRLFAQLNSTHVNGKNFVSVVDQDRLGVIQAFLEFNFQKIPMHLRMGRQDLSLGSERIIGTRDGPNNRQTYDGIRNTFQLKKATGEFFAVFPVRYQIGFFDNEINKDNFGFGTYWTIFLKNKITFDMYVFGNLLKNVCIAKDIADENRYSTGLRINKSAGSLFYELDATWQTGTYSDKLINAGQITATAGYRWQNAPLSPRIQIKGSLYTGNKDSTYNQINIFRPISGRPPVNDMLGIGPSNILLFAPEGEITVSQGLRFILRYFAVWRDRNSDGIYAVDMGYLTREPDYEGNRLGRYVTRGTTFEINYTASQHFNISLTLGYFRPCEYVNNTGKGKDLEALSFKTSYRF